MVNIPRRWTPLDKTKPREVAKALRERAVKVDDLTTAGYLELAADTLELYAPKEKKKRL